MTCLTTKYSGLMFGGQNIHAIQKDRKTESRRIVKNQPPCDPLHTSVDDPSDTFCVGQHTWWSGNHTQGIYHSAKCPWKVGQIVYVKESVRTELNEHGFDFFYKADSTNPEGWGKGVWKSPLFMPMAAARIWLLITSIRVERVQDISEADAIAEGVEVCSFRGLSAEEEYSVLWTQIHGYDDQKGWNANPWVWVIQFKRVECPL